MSCHVCARACVLRSQVKGRGEGWLVGTGYDVRRQRSFLSVFDALRLSDGPIGRAWLPYWVPYGFHGRFYAA